MSKLALILGAVTLMAMTGYLVMHTDSGVDRDEYEAAFAKFNAKHERAYKTLSDRALRFEVFKANYDLINRHNAQPDITYTLAVNKFADLTFEEFKSYYLSEFTADEDTKVHCVVNTDSKDPSVVPNIKDWWSEGVVRPAKNQAICGSGWAFSAGGSIEAALMIKQSTWASVSEQQLVDCSAVYGNSGCHGGLMHRAFNYVLDHNIHNDNIYPYTGQQQACRIPEIGPANMEIFGCVKAAPNLNGLVEAIAVTPVAVAMYVMEDLMFYFAGIYNPKNCFGTVNHAVVAYGYNKAIPTKYFMLKNSWGVDWGENGNFRMFFGAGPGNCQIAVNGWNYYPVA